jgi:crotonobetainyl-CoA:carnitine CoA-transferase CaiB-like acyl-CoA transferase
VGGDGLLNGDEDMSDVNVESSGSGVTTDWPLLGVRVTDFTHVLAGPFCTMLLADAGAEVIKVEPPGGEFARHRGTRRELAPGEWVSAYYVAVNRGKRSLEAEIKSDRGYRMVRDLIRQSDVVVENFSPGTMTKLGLDLAELRAENPRLVTASISLFGSSNVGLGTKSGVARRGLALVAEAEAGVLSQGMDPAPPQPVTTAIGDMVAGMACFAGIATALVGRERTGRGRHVDISMVAALLSTNVPGMLTQQMLSASGEELSREQAIRNSTTAPYGFYRCKDGFVAIAVNNDDSWQALLAALGRQELASDERYTFRDNRNPRVEEVRLIIEERTTTMSKREVVELLADFRVPCGLVRQSWELSQDEDLEAAGAYAEVSDGFCNVYRTPSNPFGFEANGRSVPRLNDYAAEYLRNADA